MYIVNPVNYLENFKNSLHNPIEQLNIEHLIQAIKCRLEDFVRHIYQIKHSNCPRNIWFLLTDMNLSNLQLKCIPNENVFGNLPNLRCLWLNNNQIKQLNNCLIKCQNLLELRLRSNQLHSINGQLYNLHCLEILDLSENHLDNLKEINKELSRMHFLRELNLLGNPVALQSDFKSSLLTSHSTLTVLNKNEILGNQFKSIKSKTGYHPTFSKDQSSKRKRTKPVQTKPDENQVKSKMNLDQEIEEFEAKLNKRFQAKTTTEFKCLDWSTIPSSEMKRLNSKIINVPKNIVIQSQL
ncbi:unnamed protein product [Schistosoma turkestanicum]|nr:unnamed protein product [Schistosoma turkestanicum]